MPLYEYQCARCGNEFEMLVPMSAADTQIECPTCGSEETRKLLSTFAVRGGSTSRSSDCAPTGG